MGIKLNNMTDWTPFGVPTNQTVTQNVSTFAIGQNLSASSFPETLNSNMLSFTTETVNDTTLFSANSLGFAQIIYNTTQGVQTPVNQTVQ
jgi:hypothetical protein